MKQLSVLIKPAGAACNMACGYCFYHDVANHRKDFAGVMTYEVMELVIARAFACVDDEGSIHFTFQGGEPTLAGLPFFISFIKRVKEKQHKQQIRYSLQTNGLLLDEAWALFLKQHDVLTGISLDGYESLHEHMRKDAQGEKTYWRVLRAYELLQRHGVKVNILSVVHEESVAHVKALYHFFIQHKMEYVQLIPCLPDLTNKHRYLSAQGFARFYIEMFHLWHQGISKGHPLHIGLFDDLYLMCMDSLPLTCGRLGRCAFQYVIEADGTIYPCDFYALPQFACGTLATHSLTSARQCERAEQFLKQELPKQCQTCSYLNFCRGGCKRKRDIYLEETIGYCGYREFLVHVLPIVLADISYEIECK